MEPSSLHTRAYMAALMKAIRGAQRLGASGELFGGACGGMGMSNEASSREESEGELRVGIQCGGFCKG